jgi:deoxycytidylate deaminase
MMDSLTPPEPPPPDQPGVKALDLARAAQSGFLVIGVVGAVGAGASWVARALCRLLGRRGIPAEIVTAREGLALASGPAWAAAEALGETDPIGAVRGLRALSDGLRARHDHAFAASAMIARIAALRAGDEGGAPPAVVVCDSLRHPAEAHLLRMVYGDAFWLLGTVCDLETRLDRLTRKFTLPDGTPPDPARVREFAERDQDSPDRHGQHVVAAFEIADHFVDTSPHLGDPEAPDAELDAWPVAAELARFLDLVRGERRMLRPTPAEQAMYHAYAARLGSACLSRQVGAALTDRHGQLLATGCNEVPRAGGGLYGQGGGDGDGEEAERERGRCHALNGYCSNTAERNLIIDDVLRLLDEAGVALPPAGDAARSRLRTGLRRSRLGALLEFSRSVHAEMDALVSAARKGVSTLGGKLFVTTFPCHNCARHIVAAGIDEVQFIEPYLKSKALALHPDSITQTREPGADPPSVARAKGAPGPHRVLFRPYVGAAPRLYRRAFAQDGEVKDGDTGAYLPGAPPGLMRHRPLRHGFEALEAEIAARFRGVVAAV